MEFVIVWIICGVIAAAIGAKKGETASGFIIGILLGPLGIIIALLSKGNRRGCPHCRELVHREATVCPHCQRDLFKSLSIRCPKCGEQGHVSEGMLNEKVECPSCKKTFSAKSALVEA